MNKIPSSLTLRRRDGIDRIEDANDITFHPEVGFSPLQGEDYGGEIAVAIYSTKAEADAFQSGFDMASPGDDVSYVYEEVRAKGEVFHLVLIHFGDSEGNVLRVRDGRQRARRAKR